MGLPRYKQSISSQLNSFEHARLVVADFDGTTHDTFESDPSRGIYGVNEVCKIAVEEVFDFDTSAIDRYEDQGGHSNRTPTEIIYDLTPNATPGGIARLTQAFVEAKLKVFFGQIGRPLADGTPWPRPIPGFLECWTGISQAKQEGTIINTAIASAGHASLIRLILESSAVEQPDILITDETIRGLNSTLPPSKLAKPGPLPIMLATVQWLNMHGAWNTSDLASDRVRQRITVIGDSPEKDGGLAANSGVDFIHVSNENPLGWHLLARKLRIGSFALASEIGND